MVRPDPLGSEDNTEACLRAVETDLERCWEGDLELVGAEQEVLALVSWCRCSMVEWFYHPVCLLSRYYFTSNGVLLSILNNS